ncbi:heat shock transcription factor, Y-linked-like [Cricetulus griseus]|uniref:Heat shock transcription factor, Y-linked 2 n=1 Tax=Cricetulus griseus TaxID=10029 RepID=A0A8C2LWM0_CRIGR|nr:heat shock transcription factor, Y-linked-like [Cricetulus griseus]XP_027251853.1 heat shock transcription factor, Y-linked-like [Cricetulus griseus]
MAEAPSEILDASGHDVSADSETPSSPPLCDDTGQGDSDLWAIIEESAFQVLAQRFLIKRSSHSLCASEPDEDSNLFSMTFPRKLWKIVGSDKFKSIWWDEAGTYIVINEELFKKEVLERKAPFRIFETDSMKSLVRQLNLYGFRKMRQNFQRSASLPDFLAEEKGVSASCKLQFYQNPNFLRDCPHLIERMKRRIGIKTASRGAAPSPPEFKNKHFSPDLDNMDDQSLGVAVQTRKRNLLSSPSISNVYLRQKSSTAQGDTDTMDGIRRDFSLATSSSFRPPEKILTHHPAPLNEVSPLHMDSQRIYTQANDSTMNFIITSIQNHRDVSHLWNSCIEMQAEPSFQPGYPHFSSSSSTYSDSKAIGESKLPIYKERVVSTTLASALNHHPSS